MRSILKYTALVAAVIAVITLIVIFTGGISDGKSESAKTEFAQKQTPRVEDLSKFKTSSTFTGNQMQKIEVQNGRIEFYLSYSGDSGFRAELLNPDGTFHSVITNTTGPYYKKNLISAGSNGSYTLDVKTKGEWSLSY